MPLLSPEQQQPEKQRSGIKVIRNTKGWSLEVHVYNDDPVLPATLTELFGTVAELEKKYPRGE